MAVHIVEKQIKEIPLFVIFQGRNFEMDNDISPAYGRLMNNMESQEILIHIDWSGPHSLDAVSKFNGSTDYGVYQVYGTHPVYGSGVLLYIGRAQIQTFGVRLSQEKKGWLANPDKGRVAVYLGRLWGSKAPDAETWNRHIVFAERLLIYAHEPAMNAQKELKGLVQEPELQWVHVINWHQYRDLHPEVSGTCWVGFDCQTFRHFGTSDCVASSTESQASLVTEPRLCQAPSTSAPNVEVALPQPRV